MDAIQNNILLHAVKSISECVIITDRDNKIIFVNAAFEKMYGYKEDEIIGQNLDLLRSDINSKVLFDEITRETLSNGFKGEVINRKKDGSTFTIFLSTSAIRNGDGTVMASMGIVQDITRQKLYEEQIKKQAILLNNVINSLSFPFLVFKNDDNSICFVNKTAKEFLVTIENSNQKVKEIVTSEVLNKVRALNKPVIMEDSFVENEGQERFLEIYGWPIITDNSALKEIIVYIADITAKKEEEKATQKLLEELNISRDLFEQNAEELAELNRKLFESEEKLKELNESKDKFFSILSHDLRSPFNGILGFSEMLSNELDSLTKDEIKLSAENINQSARGLLALIDDLFKWTSFETGRIEFNPGIIELNYLVREIISLLKIAALNKQITLQNKIPSNTHAYGDPNMIFSTLQNLVANAIKFTHIKGVVEINVKDAIDYMEVSVKDNGTGISGENFKKLFRLDTHLTTRGTANEKGTGLGLLLCKEQVEKNGGRIWAESEQGKGATFFFTLPKTENVFSKRSEIKEENL